MLNLMPMLNQIGILTVVCLIGLFAIKAKIVDITFKDGLSRLILDITMPLLIFSTLIDTTFSTDLLKNVGATVIFTYSSLLFLFIVATISSKIMNLKGDLARVYKLHSVFGNIVFLGFPIIGSVYGKEGIFYATIFQICADSLLWTLGVYSFNGELSKKERFRKLLNSNTIAFIIGFIFMSLSLEIPEIFKKSFSSLGGVTIYLSMIYIGIVLSQFSIKNVFKNYSVWILTLLKMIAIPSALVYITLVINFGFNSILRGVVILEIATPAMVAVAMLAKKYNKGEQYAIENLIVTTFASIVTLPFIYYLLTLGD